MHLEAAFGKDSPLVLKDVGSAGVGVFARRTLRKKNDKVLIKNLLFAESHHMIVNKKLLWSIVEEDGWLKSLVLTFLATLSREPIISYTHCMGITSMPMTAVI